jgi:hypothetical protein
MGLHAVAPAGQVNALQSGISLFQQAVAQADASAQHVMTSHLVAG